ncbi:MAG: FAD-binding oxidoreductase [Alphaproteobacteria bacterium]
MGDLQAVRQALEGLAIEDNPQIVQQKSRDFYWYSPVLKRQLENVSADLVVTPKNVEELKRVLAACFAARVPVTVRGGGTGNYGQAMPLAGGVVVSMLAMNEIINISRGRVTAGPGALVAAIDDATRQTGQELRMHPSTTKTATIAGFVAGGSGGVGSINWGGLRDLGNVLRLQLMTMEAEPQLLEITGADLHKVSHAFGTNGVITEVEMPLTAACDWIDVIVGFDDFVAAARFGDTLGNQDGILVKEIAPIAAPIPHNYFRRMQKMVTSETSVVVTMVAPQSMDAFEALVAGSAAQIIFRSDREGAARVPVAYELAWNHTTLRALRIAPDITYLQVLYPFPDHLELVEKMHAHFGDELMGHLEFVRFDGRITCFGLPLLRYTTEERLDEIIAFHEDNGCPVFNPHRYTLEEGGMKMTDEAQLAFKRQVDPRGLLNPGKMIAWDNPDFDFTRSRTYLFPGIAAAE